MKTRTFVLLCISLFFVQLPLSFSQRKHSGFELMKDKKKKSIKFETVNNLILIPIVLNGTDTLRFIFDTGVSNMLITSLEGVSGLNLNYSRKVEINGFGEGRSISAIVSTGNTVELPGIKGQNINLLVLMEDVMHLSEEMGVVINGLIGTELLKDFVIDVNYQKERLTFYDPLKFDMGESRKYAAYTPVPLEFYKGKPYLNAGLQCGIGDSSVQVKLLIDSGASHAISLFDQTSEDIVKPYNTVYSFLGSGLNGDMFGDMGRLEVLKISQFEFRDPLVSFPDTTFVHDYILRNNRNGSIGADVLRRFSIVYDYARAKMYLKPNFLINQKFEFNYSGIEVLNPSQGNFFHQVSYIREGSAAYAAGLRIGDQIMFVNGMNLLDLPMGNVTGYLHGTPGKKMKVTVFRSSGIEEVLFKVEDRTLLKNNEAEQFSQFSLEAKEELNRQ